HRPARQEAEGLRALQRALPAPGRDPDDRHGHRLRDGHQDQQPGSLPIRPRVCRLDRPHAEGPFDSRQDETRRHHPRRRRGLARSGGGVAAWIGRPRKDHSTAGRMRHGGITRAGDEGLRALLVSGATAYIQQVTRGRTEPAPWLTALLRRKPRKLAAVALANKTTRIAWRLMSSGERYDAARALAREGSALRNVAAPRRALASTQTMRSRLRHHDRLSPSA